MSQAVEQHDALYSCFLYLFCRATVICPWGELGATARLPSGEVCHSPAYPPVKLVDTLGAGDTFIAGTIHALSCGLSCADAITFGCQVAGAKCGMFGYRGIQDWYRKHLLNNSEVP